MAVNGQNIFVNGQILAEYTVEVPKVQNRITSEKEEKERTRKEHEYAKNAPYFSSINHFNRNLYGKYCLAMEEGRYEAALNFATMLHIEFIPYMYDDSH